MAAAVERVRRPRPCRRRGSACSRRRRRSRARRRRCGPRSPIRTGNRCAASASNAARRPSAPPASVTSTSSRSSGSVEPQRRADDGHRPADEPGDRRRPDGLERVDAPQRRVDRPQQRASGADRVGGSPECRLSTSALDQPGGEQGRRAARGRRTRRGCRSAARRRAGPAGPGPAPTSPRPTRRRGIELADGVCRSGRRPPATRPCGRAAGSRRSG